MKIQHLFSKILKAHKVEKDSIPAELLFASGSGLDPHISISTAYFQIERIAKSRKLDQKDVRNLIDVKAIRRRFEFLGESYVNVLLLNKSLDDLSRDL